VQVGVILLLFGLPGSAEVLRGISGAVEGLAAATRAGTRFVFGYLGGGPQPYAVADQGALFVFAVRGAAADPGDLGVVGAAVALAGA
jgi:CNT family concentrative nucleoside transporter